MTRNTPSPKDIQQEIHSRLWNLPDETENRHRQEQKDDYNRYMRQYMREYRRRRSRPTLTLHPDQEQRLREEAKNHGLPPAVLLREAAFAYLDKRYLVPEDQKDSLHAITAQLSSLGNNLNQIARQVNTNRKASARDLKAARALLERAESLIVSFVSSPPEIP